MSSFLSLASLAPEVLCHVTSYLNAQCIARLYLCGTRTLILNMTKRGGVKFFALKFRCSVEMHWPSLVRHFHTLEDFSLEQAPFGALVAVQNVDLSTLAPTLRHLCLNFFNGYASLFEPCLDTESPATFRDLKRFWPTLETIDFHMHEESTMTLSILNVLPDTLTRFTYVGPFPVDEIECLPRSLRELELELELQGQSWHKNPNFPPDLTTLSLSNVLSSRSIEHLPSGLKTLSIQYGFHTMWWEDGNFNLANLDLLPRRLRSLTVSSVESTPLTLKMVSALPRDLTTLRLMCVMLNPREGHFEEILASLPPRLTSLRLRHVDYSPHDIDFLDHKSALCALPKTLSDISSRLMQIGEALLWFPPLIRYLRLGRVTRELAAVFPETLESLVADSLYSNGDALPSGASRSLLPPPRALIDTSYLHPPKPWRFPPSLRSLDVWSFTSFEAAKALETLPNLQIALLGASSLSVALSLPPSTTQLRLNGSHSLELHSLSHLPKLANVVIDHIIIEDLHSAWRPSLPMTLHSLDLRFSPKSIHANVMLHFNPSSLPHLETLILHGLSSLSNHHLANLPRALTLLTLDSSKGQFTSSGVDQLPKYIAALTIPKPSDYPSHLPNFIQHHCLSQFRFIHKGRVEKFDEFDRWQNDRLQAQREAFLNIGSLPDPEPIESE